MRGAVVGFLCFFVGYPCRPERVRAPAENGEISELFQQREGGGQPKKSGPWLRLSRIASEFETALEGWLRFSESDPKAFELLGEYLRFPARLLLEDRLLYLARFVELYYRGGDRFEQTLEPKDVHKARKKSILEAVAEEDREVVARALARSNEKTLRERVRELVESFGETLSPLFVDVGGFAASVTDNRNYYTHYSESTKDAGRVLGGRELYELVERLLMLVRACVLREMGFGDRRIGELLREDQVFNALS